MRLKVSKQLIKIYALHTNTHTHAYPNTIEALFYVDKTDKQPFALIESLPFNFQVCAVGCGKGKGTGKVAGYVAG